jgi:flagellum-specific ATP synthase
VGIFGGSGVGKSTLIGMMTRNTEADVTVVGLVGERGREVGEFLEDALGVEGRARSVVVVSTSDQSPLLRMRAALAATTIAESFAREGKHVLLVLDSLTRFAMAAREIGLAAGEPPTNKGYTPSVFTRLARLVERAGEFRTGSITAFYTVLMEGDDQQDPLVDAVRSLLDGHVVLSRTLAAEGWYPPIEVLDSISRLMPAVTQPEHRAHAGLLRRLMHWSLQAGFRSRSGPRAARPPGAASLYDPGRARAGQLCRMRAPACRAGSGGVIHGRIARPAPPVAHPEPRRRTESPGSGIRSRRV